MKSRILIIDDHEPTRESLGETLRRAGYDVDAASNGADGIERFKTDSFAAVIVDAAQLRRWLDGGAKSGVDGVRVGMPLEEVERILIAKALEQFGGHRAHTAKALGIGVRTLTMKIKNGGLKPRRGCRVVAESADGEAD